MITWIVSSITLVLIVILLRQIFRKKISLTLQYALWLPVLLRLLIPVTPIESNFSIMNLFPTERMIVSEEAEHSVTGDWEVNSPVSNVVTGAPDYVGINKEKLELVNSEGLMVSENAEENVEEHAAVESVTKETLLKYAATVWVLGSLIMAAVFIGSNAKFYLHLKKRRVPFEQEIVSVFARKYNLPIYMVEDLASPCLFGFFSPAIYVTSKIDDKEVFPEYVIAHELCHYRRGDHIWALLRGICLVVWWWNPFVWVAAKLSVQDGELSCDEAVIHLVGEEKRLDYGKTLVNMIPVTKSRINLLYGATSMGDSKKNIRERLELIVSRQKIYISAAVAVCLLAIVALVITLTGAKDKESEGIENPNGDELSSEVMVDNSIARELTEEEKAELFAYITEHCAEDASRKIYDSVLPPEFSILSKEEWDMSYISSFIEEEVVAVIRMDQMVVYGNENLSLGPQWSSGKWKTQIYIGEKNGKLEVLDKSIPMDYEAVGRPSEENATEDAVALMERLGITYSQYRDLNHQMEGLLTAKVDHDFDSYLDFSQEEYNRYMNVRKQYFFSLGEGIHTSDLYYIHIYDWSNLDYNHADDGTPEFVNREKPVYNCEEKIDSSKDNLTATTTDIYLIEENVIGQQIQIFDENTGKVTVMEYQYTYIPEETEGATGLNRIFILGGKVVSQNGEKESVR